MNKEKADKFIEFIKSKFGDDVECSYADDYERVVVLSTNGGAWGSLPDTDSEAFNEFRSKLKEAIKEYESKDN